MSMYYNPYINGCLTRNYCNCPFRWELYGKSVFAVPDSEAGGSTRSHEISLPEIIIIRAGNRYPHENVDYVGYIYGWSPGAIKLKLV